jgi:glutathione peroxidase
MLGELLMRLLQTLALVAIGVLVMSQTAAAAESTRTDAGATKEAKKPLDVEMKTIQGKKVNLADKYKGKVVMLVNVASRCGYTPQYEQLQAMHEKYGKKGLAIVGVPCNQFGQQEPGTEKEIARFCKDKFGVEFDMMAKVDVNGEKAAPLYKYLTSKETDPKFAGDIKWNFEKFVFDREGNVVARFPSKAKPDSEEVVKVVEAELEKKPKS